MCENPNDSPLKSVLKDGIFNCKIMFLSLVPLGKEKIGGCLT